MPRKTQMLGADIGFLIDIFSNDGQTRLEPVGGAAGITVDSITRLRGIDELQWTTIAPIIDKNASDPAGRYNFAILATDFDEALEHDDDLAITLIIETAEGFRPFLMVLDVVDPDSGRDTLALLSPASLPVSAEIDQAFAFELSDAAGNQLTPDLNLYGPHSIATPTGVSEVYSTIALGNPVGTTIVSVALSGTIQLVDTNNPNTPLAYEPKHNDVFLLHARYKEAGSLGDYEERYFKIPIESIISLPPRILG